MRLSSAAILRWAIVIACLLSTGCATVCELARRTICIEPQAFYWKKDKQRSLAVYSSWADEVWSEESQGCPEYVGRPEYGVGFRDGFVDYVYAGGTGDPPPVPPRHLWNVDFRSEEGHQRAEDWYAGYRHGAQVARDGGYRSLATIRTSLIGVGPDAAYGYGNDVGEGYEIGEQGDWPTTEPMPIPEVAPTPELNAPHAPSESAEPPETAPSAPDKDAKEGVAAPTEGPKTTVPPSKPIVPPPPRNLSPTTPRNLPAPETSEPPLDLNELAPPPAKPRSTLPEATDQMEPAPLSIPGDAKEGEQPAGDEPETERGSSSVRIIDAPTVASRTQRAPRPISPPPSSVRAKPGRDPSPMQSQSAIRLTIATSTVKPAATKSPASTIRMQPNSRNQGDATPPKSAPFGSTFAR